MGAATGGVDAFGAAEAPAAVLLAEEVPAAVDGRGLFDAPALCACANGAIMLIALHATHANLALLPPCIMLASLIGQITSIDHDQSSMWNVTRRPLLGSRPGGRSSNALPLARQR